MDRLVSKHREMVTYQTMIKRRTTTVETGVLLFFQALSLK